MLNARDALALSDELGADCAVTSPTFGLIHECRRGRLPVFRADWYRIEGEQALMKIGLNDCLAEYGIVVIESADKFRTALPANTRWLEFRFR